MCWPGAGAGACAWPRPVPGPGPSLSLSPGPGPGSGRGPDPGRGACDLPHPRPRPRHLYCFRSLFIPAYLETLQPFVSGTTCLLTSKILMCQLTKEALPVRPCFKASVVSIGATGFLITGASAYVHHNLIWFLDASEVRPGVCQSVCHSTQYGCGCLPGQGGRCGECVRVHWYTTRKSSGNEWQGQRGTRRACTGTLVECVARPWSRIRRVCTGPLMHCDQTVRKRVAGLTARSSSSPRAWS